MVTNIKIEWNSRGYIISDMYGIWSGGVPLSVVCPCLHGAVCHCQTQNNFVILSKNGEATIQCG